MANNNRQLRSQLMRELGIELQPHGFRGKIKDQAYYRKTDYGFDKVSLDFVGYPGLGLDARLSISIRHDAILDLIIPLMQVQNPVAAALLYTIGGSLSAVCYTGDLYSWLIKDETDINTVVGHKMKALSDLAFPCFERLSSLEEVLRTHLSFDIHERAGLTGIWQHQAIATAYLLGDRDRYTQVYKEVRPTLFHGTLKPNESRSKLFHDLAEDLEQRWRAKEG